MSVVKQVGEALANGASFESVFPIILLIGFAAFIPVIINKIGDIIAKSREEKIKNNNYDDYEDDDDETNIVNHVQSKNNTSSNSSSKITGTQYCIYCGEKIPADSYYCMKCGRKIPKNK